MSDNETPNKSGPGHFTRALFNQISPSNYVLMDPHLIFKPCLQPLVEASNGVIKHFDLDGWDWSSYTEIINRKFIKPENQGSSKINSSLILVGNFTESNPDRADGVVAQLISFMYNKIFLYHFGRVKTFLWMQSPVWQHLLAPPGHPDRKKVSVIRELSCEARVIAASEMADPGVGRRKRAGSEKLMLENDSDIIRLTRKDFSPQVRSFCQMLAQSQTLGALVELTPFEESKSTGMRPHALIDGLAPIEELDYLTVKMFTVPRAPVERALKYATTILQAN